MKQEYPCEVCGKTVLRWPRDLTARGRSGHVFCGRVCQGAWQKESGINAGENSPAWKGGPIAVACEICGKEFGIKSTQFKRFKHRFCSRACKAEWQSLHFAGEGSPAWKGVSAERTCDQCGKMYRPRSQSKKRYMQQRGHLCGRACTRLWMSEHAATVPPVNLRESHPMWNGASAERPCDECGKIARPRSRNRNGLFFCSQECVGVYHSKHRAGANSPFWKGGNVHSYGPNWGVQKRAARKRDGYKCRYCGKAERKLKRALEVHHIKPFRTFGYIPGANDRYLRANDLTNLITLCSFCHRKAEHHKIAIQPYLL